MKSAFGPSNVASNTRLGSKSCVPSSNGAAGEVESWNTVKLEIRSASHPGFRFGVVAEILTTLLGLRGLYRGDDCDVIRHGFYPRKCFALPIIERDDQTGSRRSVKLQLTLRVLCA